MDEKKLIRVLSDFELFAECFLKIRSKSGKIKPFKFNRAQKYLNKRLDEQRQKIGRVRAIVLKGRQQGCSTNIQGRFFHRVITTRGTKAYILTHEAEATKNLFQMTKRFCDKLPDGLLPPPDASNARDLNFNSLDSGYSVGTAGSVATGRSQTIQLLHASEVAYYKHADEHAKGILQTVSNEEGTEIILESTANGIGNYFYNMWKAAEGGESDYQAIFIPWYWQEEYVDTLREGEVVCTEEEQAYLAAHEEDGLTLENLYWRRRKLKNFSSDHETAVELFNVEYPFTALDAFRNPVKDRFIKVHLVNRARKQVVETSAPLVIGVDVARKDDDKTAIIRRRGRKAYKVETFKNKDTMQVAGIIVNIIRNENPDKVCIDVIGIGAGVYDRLRELGYEFVEGVNVSRRANLSDKFINQRAELWHTMREWLAQDATVELPDNDEMMGHLTSLGFTYDSSGRLQIESKDELRKRGLPSPDIADALSLTFVMGDYLEQSHYEPNYYPTSSDGTFI